jgi:hypothetical protein
MALTSELLWKSCQTDLASARSGSGRSQVGLEGFQETFGSNKSKKNSNKKIKGVERTRVICVPKRQ